MPSSPRPPSALSSRASALLALILVLLLSPSAHGAFHLWHFSEVFSTSDGSVQFIELQNHSPGENFIAGFTLTSNSHTFTFPANLPGDTTNKFLTLGTANLAGFGFTPDYTIPASFFSPAGDTLNYASFTDTFTFGPGQLPTDGRRSLSESLTPQLASPTNYAGQSIQLVVPEPASLTLAAAALTLLARRTCRT
jgi:hypothetical protein